MNGKQNSKQIVKNVENVENQMIRFGSVIHPRRSRLELYVG